MAAQEDCRDYLRTGRCKYGASCKYNHPPNVQSGGGVRDPMNPSEPQFPIRRGEPTCQYYLKHGTCKFGQACKFHHPPQSEMAAAAMGGSAVVMNVGRNNKGSGQQIVLNSIDGSTGTSAMALQFLPQRPDEPDCIYFLRNGRCKYGATCRYHHPVAFPQSKSVAAPAGAQARRQSRRPPDSTSGMGTRVRSSSSLQMAAESIQGSRPSQGYGQPERQRESGSMGATPTHFVVTETPLAVVAGSANGPSNSYHRVSRSNSTGVIGEEFSVPLNTSAGYSVLRDYNSSSSSIASSYETATEYQGDTNGVAWSRPVKRIGSGGSLSAYDSTPPLRPQPAYGGPRTGLAPSVSDNSIASRRLRTESMGSTSDHSGAYPDAWNQSSQTASTSGWIEPSSSFEQARRARNPQLYSGGERNLPQDSSRRMQDAMRGREPPRKASSHDESNDDGGLSMMTSALLNMLDTPEEAAMKSYSSSEAPNTRMNPISPPTTPRSGHTGYSQEREGLPLEERYLGPPATGHEQYSHAVRGGSELPTSRYDFTSNQYARGIIPEGNAGMPSSTYSPVPRSSRVEALRENPSLRQSASSPSWSPSWQRPTLEGSPEQPNKPMSAMDHPSQSTGSPRTSKAHPSSNVGLYLP